MQTTDQHAETAMHVTGPRRVLNLALFPISAGAVLAEAGYGLEALLSFGKHFGLWGGILGVAGAILFQCFARTRV